MGPETVQPVTAGEYGTILESEERMITVSDWESGKATLPNDYFYPVFKQRILCFFLGEKTGVKISRGFADVLQIYQ